MKVLKKITSAFLATTLILSSVSNSIFAEGDGVDSYNPLGYAVVDSYVRKEINRIQMGRTSEEKSSICVTDIKLPGKDRRTASVFLMGAVFGADDPDHNCVIQKYLKIFKETKKEVQQSIAENKKFNKKAAEAAIEAGVRAAKNVIENYGLDSLLKIFPDNENIKITAEEFSEMIAAYLTGEEFLKVCSAAEVVSVFMLIGGAAGIVGTCISKGGLFAGMITIGHAVPTVVAVVTGSALTATGASAGAGAGVLAAATGTAAAAAEGGAAVAGGTLAAGGALAAASPLLVPALAIGSVVLVAGGAAVGGGAFVASSIAYSKKLKSERYENICEIISGLINIFQANYGYGILKNNCLVIALDLRDQSAWNVFTRGRKNQGHFVGTYMLKGLDCAPTGEEYIKQNKINYKALCENYSKYIEDEISTN